MTVAAQVLPKIDRSLCTGCGRCVELCVPRAVEMIKGQVSIVRPESCTFCDVCESNCPEGAIGRPFTVQFADRPQV